MDNQLLATMLMGQMGNQAPQTMGGMQPQANAGSALLGGGADFMKMLMLKKLMGPQQPGQPAQQAQPQQPNPLVPSMPGQMPQRTPDQMQMP